MEPHLREPLTHSYWVLILGLALILVALVWIISLFVAYRRSRVRPKFRVYSLSQAHRARYKRLIDHVERDYGNGNVDAREAHLALAAIIRAAATERTRTNLESATATEAQTLLPKWPVLAEALLWCQDASFTTEGEKRRVQKGLEIARLVVLS